MCSAVALIIPVVLCNAAAMVVQQLDEVIDERQPTSIQPSLVMAAYQDGQPATSSSQSLLARAGGGAPLGWWGCPGGVRRAAVRGLLQNARCF